MMYVVVLYETGEGFLERRVPFRAAHRAWVEQRGETFARFGAGAGMRKALVQKLSLLVK
jgi:uncharacterized protein YciI